MRVKKNSEVCIKIFIFRGLGLSVASEPECGIIRENRAQFCQRIIAARRNSFGVWKIGNHKKVVKISEALPHKLITGTVLYDFCQVLSDAVVRISCALMPSQQCARAGKTHSL